MYIVILLAAGAILGGVVVVAMGRGGEMALFDRDLPVRTVRLKTPGEVATLRLPFGFVGYQARATGEALVAAANLLAQRDAEIAELRREIWRLGGDDQMVVSQVPEPGFETPDFAAPGFEDQEVGGSSYSSASLAAWYDSIAQPSLREDEEPAEAAAGASDLGQNRIDGPDETGQLDETSRLEDASRLDDANRLDEASRQDQNGRP